MINVSFNELAIGSDQPTQRPAPSRPAEASTFAAMMDEADARQSASDAGRQRSAEPRASVDSRDPTRAERPVAAAEQPNTHETNDTPAADTSKQATAPVANDKAETVSADNKTETAAPQDKTGATTPRDNGAKTAAPSTTQTGSDDATVTPASTDQPAAPVVASSPAPQATVDQIPTDDTATNAAQITAAPLPPVTVIQPPAQPTAAPITVVPTFVAADATAPISAPQAAAPLPQNNGTQPAQSAPQQAASPPSTPQIAPDTTGNPNNTAPFAAPTFTAPAATPVASTMPAATSNKAVASTTTNSNATPVAPIAANNTAPSKPADKTGNVTSATLFAATALSQPTADSNSQPQAPVTPQTVTANTANAQTAAPQTAASIAPQSATSTNSSTAGTAAPPTATDLTQTDPSARQANTAPATQPVTPNTAPANVAVPTPMTAATLAALIGGNAGIDITVDQAAAPAPLKPAPSLANGMVAQIANAQSGETKTGSAAPTLGAIDPSAATQTATPTQTAMAVAAAPTVQAVADESKPKLAATADGLVVNAPAPTSGHTTHTAALDASAAASKPTVPNQPVFDQVAVHVAKAAAEGLDKINIKLKPVSLGQIEVQLEVATDGRVHAVIAADKPETLDLLQRDARALERALGDAGLRTDSGSLSFNLRGQGQQQFGGNASFAGFGGAERPSNDIALPIADNAMRLGAYLNSRAAAGGVDIRV